MYQHVHPHTKSELTVTVILPEDFLDKTVRISYEPVMEKDLKKKPEDFEIIFEQVSKKVQEQYKQDLEEAIRFFRSHQVDLSGYKFNRDEANER